MSKEVVKKKKMPANFETCIRGKQLQDRTVEERKRIAQMGVEARRKKKEEKMALQKCMRTILGLKPNSTKKKQILKDFGIEDEDITNKALLMVALFQKGISGDVTAIKEVINMIDKLDIYENTGKIQSNEIVINIEPVGETKYLTKAEEQEIWDIENEDEEWLEEEKEWE